MKILVVMFLVLVSACSHDSVSRRNDFSISSYTIGDITLNATLKGSKWNRHTENEVMVSEWGGPYYLFIYTSQQKKVKDRLKVTSAEIKYLDGSVIKDTHTISLQEYNSPDETIYNTLHEGDKIDLMKYQQVVVTLYLSYLDGNEIFSTKVSLLLNTRKTNRSYNLFWAQ